MFALLFEYSVDKGGVWAWSISFCRGEAAARVFYDLMVKDQVAGDGTVLYRNATLTKVVETTKQFAL